MDAEWGEKLEAAAVAATNRQFQTTPQSQPRSILTEEEYTDTLTHIVTRDYFPSIPSLRRDNAILEARSRGDVATAVAVRRAARKEETETERDWHENMQEEKVDATVSFRKRPRPLKHETITGFHARVTSEDTAEFEANQERERRELQARLEVVYSASADKTGRLMIENIFSNGVDNVQDDTSNRKSLLSESPGLASDFYNATPSCGIRITDGKTNSNDNKQGIFRNGLFFQPQYRKQDVTDSRLDNLLMPPPPTRVPNSTGFIIPFQKSKNQNIEEAIVSSSSSKQVQELVEYLPKSSFPDINPPATRFPYQSESRLLPNNNRNHFLSSVRRPSSHLSDTSASESTDLDASPRSLAREREAYEKARVRENETFVAMTPLIRPGGTGDSGTCVAEEPIMTWGNVASTPLVLGGGSSADGSDASGWEPSPLLSIDAWDPDVVTARPAFDVVDKSCREAMAQNAEKILTKRAKAYRAAGSIGAKERTVCTYKASNSSATPWDRSASLTPASRALLQASNRDPTSGIFQSANGSRSDSRSKDSFGSALRMSYTPTPDRRAREVGSGRKRSTSSMLRAATGSATPRFNKPR